MVSKGYELEIVLVDVENNEVVYKERSISRGNSQRYWNNLRGYYDSTLSKYLNRSDVKCAVFKQLYYLSDYLLFTGTMLEDSEGHKVTYVERVENMILKAFDKNLPKMYYNQI